MNANTSLQAAVVAAALAAAAAAPALADSRRFAFSYESAGTPRGVSEYEQWVTWKTDRQSDARYDRLEFRQELEHGLSDRVQLGLYFANWRYTRTSGGSDTQVRSGSVELICNLSDPLTTPLGVGVYGEVSLGAEVLEVEAKLLLEKAWGPLTVVANSILEGEWEDRDWIEDQGKFEQTLGLSRQLSPRLLLGGEALVEVAFPDWGTAAKALWYAGPNASVRAPGWWVTAAPLLKVGGDGDEPGLMLRTLVGVPF